MWFGNKYFSRLAMLALITVVVLACKRQQKEKAPESAYPDLTEQRNAQAGKRPAPVRWLDSMQMVNDLAFLSSGDCRGRKPGDPGHELALQHVLLRMRQAGVDSFDQSLSKGFTGKESMGSAAGTNVMGWIKGSRYPDKYIVITAHYDHLGMAGGGAIYHGADDNASGTAALLAMAKYFAQHPHEYSLIFAALDREEMGLEGAYAAVDYLANKMGIDKIVFNVNMDMIARSDRNEIYACGIWHFPQYRTVIEKVRATTSTVLLMGHDSSGDANDWTYQSDHGAFFKKGIPFIYFGVEDHADYHRPTDTFDKINLSRFTENANLVAQTVTVLKP